MQSLGAFGKPCLIHSSNMLTGICTFEGCNHRILCHECQLSHENTHKNYVKSILEVLYLDSDAEFQKANKKNGWRFSDVHQ